MATAPSPPILIWSPSGGVPGGPISNPPIYSQADSTALVEGQPYIDVVFGSIQTTEDWVLVTCEVENTIDAEPLNIWPGIITDRTQAGFRLQLNGMPDSENYYLHWAVSGVNILPTPATLYLFTGPATGGIHVASSNFTVRLPPSTTVVGTITVTPDDGGAGGTFTPSTVALTSSSRSTTFTYTPLAYGAVTLSVTNSAGLIDPANLGFTCVATGYAFSGPVSGDTGVASTNFTVELPVGSIVIGTVTVTPDDDGDGGTFTPATVSLTTASPTATFTYTALTDGTKILSVSNNGGLTDPDDISYVASTVFSPDSISGMKGWWKADSFAVSDGAAVTAWTDSSSAGNNMSGSGTFKTNILNTKPIVRFIGTANSFNKGSDIGVSQPYSMFVVAKSAVLPCHFIHTQGAVALGLTALGRFFLATGGTVLSDPVDSSAAFHVYSGLFSGGNGTGYIDGVSKFGPTTIGSAALQDFAIMTDYATGGFAGDVAEVLLYNSALGSTDRTNVETYLLDKYGL